MKKAVIFDMDGVLIDSEPVYLGWFLEFFAFHGVPVKKEQLAAIAGASSQTTFRIVSELWSEAAAPEELRALFQSFAASRSMSYRKIMFPNVKPLLNTLTKRGCTLALASSSSFPSINRMLAETGTTPFFDLVVSGRMFRESKPNPEIYLYTLRELKLGARDCLAVEDSTYGIQAAKAAGIPVAAIRDDRFHFDQSMADFLIDDILKVLDCLDN